MKYRADYRASDRVKELEAQSSKINIEIQTLLSWKPDLQDDLKTSQERLKASQDQLKTSKSQFKELQAKVEAKQGQIDKASLRSTFASAEVRYAIGHLSPLAQGAERAGLDDLTRTLDQLPADTRRPIERIIANYRTLGDIVTISQRLAATAHEAAQSIPAAEWAQKFRACPVDRSFQIAGSWCATMATHRPITTSIAANISRCSRWRRRAAPRADRSVGRHSSKRLPQ